MPTVHLDDEEWQRVMAVLAQAPWNIANPLLMKIGEQLRQHALANQGNSQEMPANTAQLGDKHTH